MSVSVSCVRCGGPVRPPGLAASDWHCLVCGPVLPLRVPNRVGADVVESVAEQTRGRVPLWCPWPPPQGWLLAGLGWAGDSRSGPVASVLAFSGPAPLHAGPADLILVAEEPGVGLGNRFAGVSGPDAGERLVGVVPHAPHARLKAAGRDTPMWAIDTPGDRVAYVGEARGMWLYAVAWPSDAGYVLCENIVLRDLSEWLPAELVYGAPSPYLHGRPGNGSAPQ